MKLVQFYETNVLDADSGVAFNITVLTQSAWQHGSSPWPEYIVGPGDFIQLLQELGLRAHTSVRQVGQARDLTPELIRLFGEVGAPSLSPHSTAFELSEAAINEQLIPFENSLLELSSLDQLIKAASATGLGAYAAYQLVNGSPLLAIALPAGVILMGAAKGVSQGLEEGLRLRLLEWMGVRNKG
ncbi:MAG TPA: hypothetical protein VIR57_16190 [Chloroflexota bacterium]